MDGSKRRQGRQQVGGVSTCTHLVNQGIDVLFGRCRVLSFKTKKEDCVRQADVRRISWPFMVRAGVVKVRSYQYSATDCRTVLGMGCKRRPREVCNRWHVRVSRRHAATWTRRKRTLLAAMDRGGLGSKVQRRWCSDPMR